MIYEPAEDSFLLEAQVKKFSKGKRVLDMGAGSGIIGEAALSAKAKSVLFLDISKKTVDELKRKNFQARKSNLFSALKKSEKFDIIAFNPPYLPMDKREDKESALITSGGKKGDEITIKFLKEAHKHLSKDGFLLLLLSSLTPRDRILKIIFKNYSISEVIATQKLSFEELEIYKIDSK